MELVRRLQERDRGFAALRRAGRTAIVMPAMFALGAKVLDNPDLATFGAFGSFATLLLVDFGGPTGDRVRAHVALGLVGGVFVCVGTLASRNAWLAAGAMAIVGFGVIFAGVVSSVLAGASTSLLLAFILPVSLVAPAASIPSRLAGWGLASVASLLAVLLLWPAPARDPLRGPAALACRALATRLRSDVVRLLGAEGERDPDEADEAAPRPAIPGAAVAALRRTFLATPYRPTGLSTATRTVVRLVDELTWLDAIVTQSAGQPDGVPVNRAACAVRSAAAAVLERGADLLERPAGDPEPLHTALTDLDAALAKMEHRATHELPVGRAALPGAVADVDVEISEFITSLDPSFRAQELAFAVSLVARNIDLAAAAERRSWVERLLGRQPEGLPGTLSAAQERAAAHVAWHSVWLHNSVRGGAGLGLAVLVADLTGVQHSFWVVLGALSVLRSNALSTGQNAMRGLLGTVAGFALGALLLVPIGTNTHVLWVLLPLAILVAGVAPAAIGFATGQAGFTVVLVILFNIIAPAGWRVGLLRVEDVAIGCAVSLVVGLLFWPRGAAAALSRALSVAYTDSAEFLARAVEFGMVRCDVSAASLPPPTDEAVRAAAASRRLDDTFRAYLAERGAKPVPLPEVSSLVAGVAGLRLAADAVLDLWQREDGQAPGDRAGARGELLSSSEAVRTWYQDFAASIVTHGSVRDPLQHDLAADARLVDAVRTDLRLADGRASATAVRMIWTGDHLDAARRLQATLVGPARAVNDLGRPDDNSRDGAPVAG
jgi:Fusaric acid resistance protein-like